MVVECNKNVAKVIKIDGVECDIKHQGDDTWEVWFAEKDIEGIDANGKDVKIYVSPIDESLYNQIEWSIKLKEKATKDLSLEYKIDEKNKSTLPASFVDDLEKGKNPILEIKTDTLKLELLSSQRVFKAKICNEIIKGDKFNKTPDSKYKFAHSIKLEKEETQIEIIVFPEDVKNYKIKTLKFIAKINNTPSTIFQKEKVDIFQINEKGSSANPFANDFLEHLADNSFPEHAVIGKTAEIKVGFTNPTHKEEIDKISFKIDENNAIEKILKKLVYLNGELNFMLNF